MLRRRDRSAHPAPRRGLRVGIALTGTAVVGGAALLLGAGAGAGAAPSSKAPTPSYTAGNDAATMTVNGVVDGNCPVSVGGDAVWIKPGDKITFDTALAGLNVGVLALPGPLGGLTHLTTSQIAGMDVTGWIGSPSNKINVAAGKESVVSGLKAGTYKYSYTAKDVVVLPALGGVKVPLSSSALKSGAKLTWTGKIYVTTGAPQCTISVGTPSIGISAGPIKISVPPVRVSVPVPNVPKVSIPTTLPGGGGTTSTHKSTPTKTTSSSGSGYIPPGQTVPERTVPKGGAGGGGFYQGSNGFYGNPLPDSGNGSSSSGSGGGNGSNGSGSGSDGKSTTKRVDLAANRAPAGQMPVLLAILAIIALSLVTATYARLYLLRRNTA